MLGDDENWLDEINIVLDTGAGRLNIPGLGGRIDVRLSTL